MSIKTYVDKLQKLFYNKLIPNPLSVFEQLKCVRYCVSHLWREHTRWYFEQILSVCSWTLRSKLYHNICELYWLHEKYQSCRTAFLASKNIWIIQLLQQNNNNFSSTIHNKSPLISMLCKECSAANILVKQANNDDDLLLNRNKIIHDNKITIVVREVVHFLGIMTARTSSDKIIFISRNGPIQTKNILSLHRIQYLNCLKNVKIQLMAQKYL